MEKKFYHEIVEFSRDRREFMKRFSIGAAGMAVAGLTGQEYLHAANILPGRAKVSFVPGFDRRAHVYKALEPFREEIEEGIRGKEILIKANLVEPRVPISATHVDATRAVLDMLREITDRKIMVGDSNGRPGGTAACFEAHNYYPLEDEYDNIELVDLNYDDTTTQWILTRDFHPQAIDIINRFLDPNIYRISLTRLKTHTSVLNTLSIKNMAMGSPVNVLKNKNRQIRGQKTRMHYAGNKGLNFNLFKISQKVRADFCVLDGTVGMEGNGPTGGTAVEHGVVLAGPDMLAVDRVGTELMGIPFEDIGYMNYMSWAGMGQADLNRIDIIGPDIHPHIVPYKLPENVDDIVNWRDDLVVDKI